MYDKELTLIEQIFSNRNLKEAAVYFKQKPDSCSFDGVLLSEVYDYYKLNEEYILNSIYKKNYQCKKTILKEMLNYRGKKRIIAKMCSIDRFISRVMEQVLVKEIDKNFSSHSFAYRENYGVHKAVELIRDYIKDNQYVCSIDIKNFFDEINHAILSKELYKYLQDEYVIYLIECFIKCEIEYDFISSIKTKGIIQGNSLSPLLSNLYLDSLDHHLEKKDINFVRFADNIYMFFNDKAEAYDKFNHVKQVLEGRYNLYINKNKSGVFPALDMIYLGYKIHKKDNEFEILKVKREKVKYHSRWHTSPLRYQNHQYHIIDDGILRRNDFSILFENEQQKVELPVEVIDHINIHSQIAFSSSFFEIMNDKKIIINIFNKNGVYIGKFLPNNQSKSVSTALNQAINYRDKSIRLDLTKKFINASIHNERSNIKYYFKKIKQEELKEIIDNLTNELQNLNECKTYEESLLIEARAKQLYYQSFQYFIKDEHFQYEKRSKRPPQNNINALISFGNTVLYNIIANEIYKTTLDIRIGYLHASNNRKESLNLDFADVFKPIIIDRVIFTMINKKMITDQHFESRNNGIYLTKEGKSIFIHQIYEKLYTHINYKNRSYTYYSLIRINLYSLLQHINSNKKLKLYKYQ